MPKTSYGNRNLESLDPINPICNVSLKPLGSQIRVIYLATVKHVYSDHAYNKMTLITKH